MRVTLTTREVAIAELVGAERYAESRALGQTPRYGLEEDHVRRDQHAAGAEVVACKVLGGWWEGIGPEGWKAAGDVRAGGTLVEVRHSTYDSAFLPLYPTDPAITVVFVVGTLPTFRVVGWGNIAALRAEHPLTDKNPRGGALRVPCHVVEQAALFPVSDRRVAA